MRRMFTLLQHTYTRIEPMAPPYPDVRVTTPSSRIAVEVTEVHWGVGPKGGSPTRKSEEAAIRTGAVATYSAQADPVPSVVQAVENKCGKSYRVGPGDDLWLALLGASSAAPASTFILTLFLDLSRLATLTNDRLSQSEFS